MKIDEFDFKLPNEAIALRPASPRDSARMLVVPTDQPVKHDNMRALTDYLDAGDILVFNDTKVIPARLIGKRGEAKVEITLHKFEGKSQWWAFAKPAKKCRVGDILTFDGLTADVLTADVLDTGDGGQRLIQFQVEQSEMSDALQNHGIMPLPPYIAAQRPVDAKDLEDYQTVFADKEGAVAAPTAGLHFTPALIKSLQDKGVQTASVTLHVGAGTFLPVKVEDTADHKMHSEWGEITQETAALINDAMARGNKIVSVGTTSLRLLESAAAGKGKLKPFKDDTDIFITPGYEFKIVDRLITNFHLPKSTLFMLVSAFCGLKTMQNAYKTAIEEGYRFYSYGDGSLLYRADKD